MNWFSRVMLCACLGSGALGPSLVHAGVIIGGTRLIYHADKKQAALSITNPDKHTDYLIQSWVDHFLAPETGPVPFIITPPLFRLDAEQENLLRVVYTGSDLPTDRESIYWLSVKSIAATERSDENRLQIAVRSRIKLIYRPVGLASGAAEAYKALRFSRQGEQLSITNPTPYFVSLQSVKVGDHAISNPGMVPPLGRHVLSVPARAAGSVAWQAINDYGGISDTAHQ
jgi:P pilus assembly chaperone PapD